VADVVFVGGSLVASGGHNMLEPARLSKPVLFGPHTSNFRDAAASLTAGGGGFVVATAAELATRLRYLLAEEAERERAGAAGHAAVASRQGAVQRTLDLLSDLLGPMVAPGAAPRSGERS
jgi:3-deoxy-D-manno-octulosonic-acid transferase